MFLRSGQHVQTFRESVQAGDHREIANTPESGLLADSNAARRIR